MVYPIFFQLYTCRVGDKKNFQLLKTILKFKSKQSQLKGLKVRLLNNVPEVLKFLEYPLCPKCSLQLGDKHCSIILLPVNRELHSQSSVGEEENAVASESIQNEDAQDHGVQNNSTQEDVEKPDVEEHNVEKPDVEKPDVEKPDVEKPDIEKTDGDRSDPGKTDDEKTDDEHSSDDVPKVIHNISLQGTQRNCDKLLVV